MVSDSAANETTETTTVIDAFVDAPKEAYSYDRLHIEVSGPIQGEPVVLLHGWGSSAKLMTPIANALSAEFNVHNIDLPGHGQSPTPSTPLGLVDQAALVELYVRDKFSKPVVLIGHSNGGRISLYLASRKESADLIDKLVLVSPSGIRPRRGLAYYTRSTIARTLKFPTRMLSGTLREAVLDWLTHSFVWRMLGSSDYNALSGTMRQSFVATVNYYVDDVVAKITCPTLLFWGDKDTAVSLRQMKLLESRIADCGLVVLPGAGHYGYLDQPGVVLAATRYFLNPDAASADEQVSENG